MQGRDGRGRKPSGGCLSRWSQEVTRELVMKIESQDGTNIWKVNMEGLEGEADLEGRGQARQVCLKV